MKTKKVITVMANNDHDSAYLAALHYSMYNLSVTIINMKSHSIPSELYHLEKHIQEEFEKHYNPETGPIYFIDYRIENRDPKKIDELGEKLDIEKIINKSPIEENITDNDIVLLVIDGDEDEPHIDAHPCTCDEIRERAIKTSDALILFLDKYDNTAIKSRIERMDGKKPEIILRSTACLDYGHAFLPQVCF